MTSGVFRPYTLQDVLGTMNEQSNQQTGSIVTAQGFFTETDDGMTTGVTMTATASTNPTWDAGTWGFVVWS